MKGAEPWLDNLTDSREDMLIAKERFQILFDTKK